LEYDERRGTELLSTLETWYAAGGSLAATARLLHVHANTVSQRLDRIGVLLGEGWRDPERALEHQLALRLHRLRK
jgi:DNA-binding PucR family transcriptional regulator